MYIDTYLLLLLLLVSLLFGGHDPLRHVQARPEPKDECVLRGGDHGAYVCVYIYMRIYVIHMYNMNKLTYIYIYIHTYMYTICTYTHVCMHACMYVCMNVCMYVM